MIKIIFNTKKIAISIIEKINKIYNRKIYQKAINNIRYSLY